MLLAAQQLQKFAASAANVHHVLAAAEVLQILLLPVPDIGLIAAITLLEQKIVELRFALDFGWKHRRYWLRLGSW